TKGRRSSPSPRSAPRRSARPPPRRPGCPWSGSTATTPIRSGKSSKNCPSGADAPAPVEKPPAARRTRLVLLQPLDHRPGQIGTGHVDLQPALRGVRADVHLHVLLQQVGHQRGRLGRNGRTVAQRVDRSLLVFLWSSHASFSRVVRTSRTTSRVASGGRSWTVPHRSSR